MAPLDLIYALWYLRRLRSDLMPRVAAGLLEDGYEVPSLRLLASMVSPDERDVEALVAQAIEELGLPPLSPLAATIVVAKHVAAEALMGTTELQEGAAQVEPPRNHEAEGGSSPGLQPPVEDGERRATRRAEVERDILEAARGVLPNGK